MSDCEAMEKYYRQEIASLYDRLRQQASILRVEGIDANGNYRMLNVLRVYTTTEGTIFQVSI